MTHLFALALPTFLFMGRLETIDIFIEDHRRRFDFLAPSLTLRVF